MWLAEVERMHCSEPELCGFTAYSRTWPAQHQTCSDSSSYIYFCVILVTNQPVEQGPLLQVTALLAYSCHSQLKPTPTSTSFSTLILLLAAPFTDSLLSPFQGKEAVLMAIAT